MQNSLFKPTNNNNKNSVCRQTCSWDGQQRRTQQPIRMRMHGGWMRAQQVKVCREGQHREKQEAQMGTRRLATQPERKACREPRSTAPSWHEPRTTNASREQHDGPLCFGFLFSFTFSLLFLMIKHTTMFNVTGNALTYFYIYSDTGI